MLTKDEVAQIKERAEKATPPPWDCGSMGDYVALAYFDPPYDWNNDLLAPVCEQTLVTGDFIAHARQDVPALCASYEELRGLLRKLEHDISTWVNNGMDDYEQQVAKGKLKAIRAALGEE